MNYKEFPGAAQHGDAWKYFAGHSHEIRGLDAFDKLVRWHWFLSGWIEKGKQRVDVRCKTR